MCGVSNSAGIELLANAGYSREEITESYNDSRIKERSIHQRGGVCATCLRAQLRDPQDEVDSAW